MRTYPSYECSLKEANNLQRDLKTDWYQVVIENHKCQKVEYKVLRLYIYRINTTTVQI